MESKGLRTLPCSGVILHGKCSGSMLVRMDLIERYHPVIQKLWCFFYSHKNGEQMVRE